MTTKGPTAVVLTALPLEFDAVVDRLSHVVEVPSTNGGPVFEVGEFETESATWRIAVAEVGPGNHSAAIEATRALEAWKPDIAAFIGVAGGVKDVAVGDVVIGSRVYAYESGKETAEGLRPRPVVYPTNAELVHLARGVAKNHRRKTREVGSESKYELFVGAIAAGEKVVADVKADSAQLIARGYGDTLAVEMEGAGFMRAAHECNVRAVVVRGVSDLLSGKAEADAGGGQPLAAGRAADAWFELLRKVAARAPQHELEEVGVTPSTENPESQAGDNASEGPKTQAGVDEELVPVLISEMYANGQHNLLYAKRIEADRNFLIDVQILDDNNRTTLRRLARNPRGRVGLTYGLSAFLCEVVSAKSSTVPGSEIWQLELREVDSYGIGSFGETSLQTGGRTLSPEDFAVLRARRLLLNEEPFVEDQKEEGTVGAEDLNRMMYELHLRGMNYPVAVLRSPIPKLYELIGADEQVFKVFARLLLVHQVRLSGVADDVERLDLAPSENGVIVDFRGTRTARYTNMAPTPVEVKGICLVGTKGRSEGP